MRIFLRNFVRFKLMKFVRQSIRFILVSALLIAVVLPATLFLVLSTPPAQRKIKNIAEAELTQVLGTDVAIGNIIYHPFNTLEISDVTVADPARPGVNALAIGRVSARFELFHFLRTGRLYFDYAVLFAPQVRLWRASAGEPLNIQPIIDRFKPKDPSKPPTHFDLAISTLIIRQGHFGYTVQDAAATPGRFNPRRIDVDDLYLHAYLRNASPTGGAADIEALSFSECSGFRLSDLKLNAAIDSTEISVSDFSIALPNSYIALQPVNIAINGLKTISDDLRSARLQIATSSPGTISTGDIKPFLPILDPVNVTATLDFDLRGNLNQAELYRFNISAPEMLDISMTGKVVAPTNPDSIRGEIELRNLSVYRGILPLLDAFIPSPAATRIAPVLPLYISGDARGGMRDAVASLDISTAAGDAKLDARCTASNDFSAGTAEMSADFSELNLAAIVNNSRWGTAGGSLLADVSFANKKLTVGKADINIDHIGLPGHTLTDVGIKATADHDELTLNLESADPVATLTLDAHGDLRNSDKWISLSADIRHAMPEAFGTQILRPGLTMRGHIQADIAGTCIDDISGRVDLNNWLFTAETDSLSLARFSLETLTDQGAYKTITINSDYLTGQLNGRFTPSTLAAELKEMAAQVSPALITPDDDALRVADNTFSLQLTTDNGESLSRFLRLPVVLAYPVEILADVNSANGSAWLTADAPYLVQGDKIIENTLVNTSINSAEGRGLVYLTTLMPTKKGPMTAVVGISGKNNTFDTHIDWTIDRAIPLNGTIPLSTTLSRSAATGDLCISNRFGAGQINFGDDVWAISPGGVDWCDKVLTVNDFGLKASAQSIAIDGAASASTADTLNIDLKNIHLISIFENLEIDNALIGGRATGSFTATAALSGIPQLNTTDLHVDSISYNYCEIGDADIKAGWDNDTKGFALDADIRNRQGQPSHIFGSIYPTTESLDLNFEATHVPVGFMQPFMAAFASDITGYVSGNARLFGTFKNIDMSGDVFADSLRLRIDFTNTYYSATDSIHVRPGIIRLDDITLYDASGHTARLDGVLTHRAFHYPEFEFNISNARDFLSYDVTEKINPDWYGTVFGNGSASISGKPGLINIGVNMTTCPGSTFTFVLSDRLDAEQYSFITFNDVTEYSSDEILLSRDDTPELVQEIRRRLANSNTDEASNYVMDIRADITPQAQINLVMDPIGGDCIRANGSGDLRMYYDAKENDLRMYGTYTLDHGSYNFTLQDIIIKDFTINRGSSIAFRGDPYSASLDIEAVYQVNANLSDLDESFARDKDLNRTNVPVQAVMKVTGDMRQPDLAFDLAFPTLTSDTYRKVRSIISTDDMMNRQIIYLLALNRFYTPEYMASTTKGNELFSVAAGTISSQLSSMLGKLSDHWSIAPNLRSDRGDFSDLEVDLALSSRLLNNRLLFNGNFGYRDKSLNTNQFIGDFDLEYILNPSGIWRLKAYNRYNDQNYYLRSAPTTQGVGIMFRRDFDSFFSIFRKKKQPK